MSECLVKQLQLQRSLVRCLENFKKLGKTNLTPAKVRSRITTAKETWQQFQDGHAALLATIPEEHRRSIEYFKDEVFDTTEDQHQLTLDYMTECLEDLEPIVSPSHSFANSTRVRSDSSAFSLSHLPAIQLPPFDGNYEDWEPFRDRFKAIITENRDLNDFARMHFLASTVKGRALDAISHIAITADNFEIAWHTLTSRFENKQRALNAHFSTLFSLPELTKESPSGLQGLHDKMHSAVAALNKIASTKDELWNNVLVYSLVQKLDPVTRKAWKLKVGDREDSPSYDELSKFLQSRARALEEISAHVKTKLIPKSAIESRVHVSTMKDVAQSACPLCKKSHLINACSIFLSKNPSQRRELVREHKRCFNCLSAKHVVIDCKSKYSCRLCNQKHHSTLHTDSNSRLNSSGNNKLRDSAPTPDAPTTTVNSLSAATNVNYRQQVLLATARVRVRVSSGREVVVRALIDQGSEMTFINENIAQILRAPRIRMPISIAAVGGINAGSVKHAAQISISPRHSASPSLTTNALILKALTAYTPKHRVNLKTFEHLSEMRWADDDPTSAEPINLIIGADLYPEIIRDGIRTGGRGEPIAQKSIFGWIISGPTDAPIRPDRSKTDDAKISVNHIVESIPLENELQRFWELEDIPTQSIVTPLDKQCEEHFQVTHSRAPDGRYVVRLPFKSGPPIDIGDSRNRATKLFNATRRRLNNNRDLSDNYREFMAEYEKLGHMKRMYEDEDLNTQTVYIPHHAVIRESSSTTRLRVVFNASSVTSNGLSLNDHMLAGPKLQREITSVILNWRAYRYVGSADIAKMYRQIWVDSRDLNYQRILWTAEPSAPPESYQLLTVTYGTACAPFLALRVLEQLRLDEGLAYPLASEILKDNIYVDDVVFGADDPTSLKEKRDQLISLLGNGGFTLRKWASNSEFLLSDLDEADHGLACDKQLASDDRLNILGIAWHPSTDIFKFNISIAPTVPQSKRSILSTIAKFYDPLGWVTPVTVAAKILMQQLWRRNLRWDDPIPHDILSQWEKIYSRLSYLHEIRIPRWNGLDRNTKYAEIHGFSNASNLAYSAAVYLKVISISGKVTVTLLAAKSKVAPLKPLSIPRLELSGALLLSRLLKFIRTLNGFESFPYYCWTDSTIVLAWVTQHPSRWKTFVANRVTTIQARLPHGTWRHVPTQDNPADKASRGMLGDEILNHSLWWQGPSWLTLTQENWPTDDRALPKNPPLEKKVIALQCVQRRDDWDLESRYSSWPKLIRVTAYLYRFIKCCKTSRRRDDLACRSDNSSQCLSRQPSRARRNVSGRESTIDYKNINLALSVEECNTARTYWIKKIQSELFENEITALLKNQCIASKSPILQLKPFIDSEGILRVGGRLEKAPLPFSFRHPILLGAHKLVTLIASQAHLRALHSGPQLTLNILRREFWILRSRRIVKAVIYRCIKCTRERAAIPTQIMGNLPDIRVSKCSRSFLHCGLDYAGPVFIRASSGRGSKSSKAYIVLFVCLSTKAIHLELVSDCSTSAFLNAYSRFCSRRGLPRAMYSDNATTFIGADRELTMAYRSAVRDPDFLNKTAADQVSWHFIPPSAPHFGGLWEAGVKSVKYHLRRVVNNHTLTFEEFTTLLCRIEACLNSRPIAPLSDTLDDYECLTPGHFLIGSAITVNPEPTVLGLNENRLSRWQMVRHMTERFWKLWQNDYVNTLQQRQKWRKQMPPVKVGQLVLLRNQNLPPCKWELGRIKQCHAGSDQAVRVVTVKTNSAEYKRPLVKLCVLPIESDELDHAAPAKLE